MGKVAIVTGAGTGIGKAVALQLCRDGFDTVFAGRRPGPIEEAAAEAKGARAIAISTDVADEASVAALFARATAEFGRIDVLFNNAGTGAPPVPLEELTGDQWRNVVNTNLNGMFYCLREAFRYMKAQDPRGGRIVNNGSISATAPRPDSMPYTATKHAVTGLTKSGSLDGRKYDIAVGQIDIGNAGTEMTERMKTGIKQANGAIAPEPTMNVENVAKAVSYMASLPLDANVQFMTVMATKMPFIARG